MGVSLPSRRVVRVLNELVAVHGRPTAVRVDNGLPQKSRRQSFSASDAGQLKPMRVAKRFHQRGMTR
jgi:hypothetical protein